MHKLVHACLGSWVAGLLGLLSCLVLSWLAGWQLLAAPGCSWLHKPRYFALGLTEFMVAIVALEALLSSVFPYEFLRGAQNLQ